MLGAVPLILGMMRGGGTQPLLLVGDGTVAATYSRPSGAFGFDAGGILFTAASGTPRLLIERGSQNLVQNPRFEGGTTGVIGSGGVMPTDTSVSTAASVTRQVVGFGTEDGIPFLDLRLAGTQSNTNVGLVTLGTWSATVGQTFALSLCTRLVAGSMAGINTFRLRVHEKQGATNLSAYTKLDFAADGAPLQLQRRSAAHTMLGANADGARLQLAYVPFANQAFDFTWRIGLPQVEPGGVVMSPILPPAGSPGVSARAAGSLLHAPAGGMPGRARCCWTGRCPSRPPPSAG